MKMTSLLVSVFFLGLTACSSLNRVVQKPSVEVDSIHVEDPSLTAMTMVFGIRVDNPNSFSIPVSSLRYDLRMNGNDLAKGTFDDAGKIPPRGNTVVKIPVRVSYFSLYKTAKAISDSKRVNYEIKGDIDAGGITVPFSDAGNFDLANEKAISE